MTENTTPTRIVDAAVELFYEQGYQATSLRQVAERVGLQVGSLYNHISSKQELLFSIMRDIMMEVIEFTEQQVSAAGSHPLDRLVAFMESSIHFHATRPRETFIGNTELRSLSEPYRGQMIALRRSYEESLGQLIQEAADAGSLELEDLDLAVKANIAICTSVASWYRPGGRLDLNGLKQRLIPLFGPLACVDTSGRSPAAASDR